MTLEEEEEVVEGVEEMAIPNRDDYVWLCVSLLK